MWMTGAARLVWLDDACRPDLLDEEGICGLLVGLTERLRIVVSVRLPRRGELEHTTHHERLDNVRAVRLHERLERQGVSLLCIEHPTIESNPRLDLVNVQSAVVDSDFQGLILASGMRIHRRVSACGMRIDGAVVTVRPVVIDNILTPGSIRLAHFGATGSVSRIRQVASVNVHVHAARRIDTATV